MGRDGAWRVHVDSVLFPSPGPTILALEMRGKIVISVQVKTKTLFLSMITHRNRWEVGFLLLQRVVWRTHLQCGGPLTALEKAPCFLPSPFPAETLFRGGFLRQTMGSQTRGVAPQPGPSLLAAAVTVLELSAQGGRGVSGSPLFPQRQFITDFDPSCILCPLQHVHSPPRITVERIQKLSFSVVRASFRSSPPICESFPD